MTRIARVFPVRTKATPSDDLAFVGSPGLFPPEVDAVHISVAFTWHRRWAEDIARDWKRVGPIAIGGPAYDDPGAEFIPGRYLRPGYVITSRGCPSQCRHCFVPRREGPIRELPIYDGWNILDNNLLACSRGHVEAVMQMAARQKRPTSVSASRSWRVSFTGGLEAARLEDWHVELLTRIHPQPAVFFAYDSVSDLEPLREAAKKMIAAGWRAERHDVLRVYVLIGQPGDDIYGAEIRLRRCIQLGFTPMAMLYRDEHDSRRLYEWRQLQRHYARPALMYRGPRK